MKRIAAVFALLAVLLWLPGCTSYASAIEKNWGLRLPDGYREVYSADTGASFHGDGVRYHVFQYEEGAALPDAAWGEASGPTIYASGVTAAAEDFLGELEDLPAQWRIPYADCVAAYDSQEDNSELLLFLDETTRTLYVVESFL